MDFNPLSSPLNGQVAVPSQPWSRYTVILMVFVFGLVFSVFGFSLYIYNKYSKQQALLEQYSPRKQQYSPMPKNP